MSKLTSATLARRIATNLAAHRVGQGITQAGLAHLSGIAAASISRFECNARCPSILNLVRLADALNIPVDSLLE